MYLNFRKFVQLFTNKNENVINLRGMAAANLSESAIKRCLSSCLPIFGGPIRTIGLLWVVRGEYSDTSS